MLLYQFNRMECDDFVENEKSLYLKLVDDYRIWTREITESSVFVLARYSLVIDVVINLQRD